MELRRPKHGLFWTPVTSTLQRALCTSSYKLASDEIRDLSLMGLSTLPRLPRGELEQQSLRFLNEQLCFVFLVFLCLGP